MKIDSQILYEANKLIRAINSIKPTFTDNVNYVTVKDPKTKKTYKLQKSQSRSSSRSSNFR